LDRVRLEVGTREGLVQKSGDFIHALKEKRDDDKGGRGL
jgi:hypothetical protein